MPRSFVKNLKIRAGDEFELGATLFEPRASPRGVVIVNGAMAVRAGYYARFAEHLAASGLAVVTYDYRGVGASRPLNLRGFRATLTEWAQVDARAVHEFARRSYGGLPLVTVGHSFGGQILGLSEDMRDSAGAVLVAAQHGYFGHWPLPTRLRYAALWHAVLPSVTATFGYLPGRFGLGEDVPAGVAEEWASWCRHPDYLIGHHPAARARLARFDRPVLAFSFTDDDYAPDPAVDHLLDSLSHAPLEHRRLAPADLEVDAIGHFGFFRPPFADTLWRDTRWFIEDLIADRPRFQPLRARAPWAIREEDVFADLAYGRA
jgi:predicted alpha/beta hydrolase